MSSTSQTNVTSYLDTKDSAPSEATGDAVGVLMWFGALMLRAGNTATRTREWIDVIARQMGFATVAVSLSLDSITVSVCRSGEWVTTMREIGPPGINAWRIAELEQLARTVRPGDAPRDIAARLEKIESTAPRYATTTIATAVGAASAGFAFLNGAATREMIAAAIGGGIGQWLRLLMSHRHVNQYGAAALLPLRRREHTFWRRRLHATPASGSRIIRPVSSPPCCF
jgi:uncharacterized membrane protein YjjP (DUF1212 family)